MPLSISIKYVAAPHYKQIKKIEKLLDEPIEIQDMMIESHTQGRVAFDDELGVLGYVVWSKECPIDREIIRLAVHPDHRRTHIGSMLLESLEDRLPPIEALTATVPVSQTAMTRLFLANKYEMTSKFQYRGCGHVRFLKWIT